MKKAKNRTLCFESTLPPENLIQAAHDTAINTNYHYFSRTEKGFLVQIDANHGGKEFLECEVSTNGKNGSIINGKITHQSWYANEKQSTIEKIRDWVIIVFVCIVFFPILIIAEIYDLILRLFKKEQLSRPEKQAIEFMTKIGCQRKKTNE